jgi:C4-dicarboxylate-specific signal transduction histidine kinase
VPIHSKDGTILADLIMCWREPEEPQRRHRALIDVAARLAGIAIERDQTRKLLVEQQAKMVTSSKLAALGEMAAGMAHEINNPLAIISGSADELNLLVQHKMSTPEHLTEIATTIRSTVRRISKIIKGLHSFSRDAEDVFPERAAVRAIVDETLAFCQERFRIRGVELRVSEIDPSLTLMCRPVQLSQVLLNLLNNSYDAVEGLDERWIQLDVQVLTGSLVISVTDSGAGISSDLRESIMQPFFTTKEVGRGTGLGLSISSGIVARHGGVLALDPNCANTRFTITLPVRQESQF